MIDPRIYDPIRRELRPDYGRLADARYIKRNRVTDEISWPPTDMIAQLREAGLVSSHQQGDDDMKLEFIAYHNQTKVIVGIGATAADAIVDARWNVGNPDSDDSAWQTIPADDDLIDDVRQFGGAVWWHINNNVAVLT